ncbi:MAG: hypothetical protein RL536_381 [Candidatus Parcubacteria bacterium]
MFDQNLNLHGQNILSYRSVLYGRMVLFQAIET